MFQKYALTVHTCIIKLLFIVSTNVINTGRLSSDHSKYLIHITCLKIVQVQWMSSIIFLKMKDLQPYTHTCRFFSLSFCVELIECFEMFDKNRDGTISVEELGSILRALGQNPTKAQVDDIMKKADKNGKSRFLYIKNPSNRRKM